MNHNKNERADMSGIKPNKKPYLFLAVVILGIIASIYFRLQLNYNAGHIDEYDYLFVGKQFLAGKTWSTYFYIFGSDLSWYIYGLGESIGGLAGARLVAGLFGLLSIVGIYQFVKVLFKSKEIALLSAAIFSFQAVHVFISKLATYDIICIAFLTLSFAPLLLAAEKKDKNRYAWLVLGVLLFSLAVTSKYTAIVYFPLITLALMFISPWIAVLFGVSSGLILGAYVWLHQDALKVLYEVQILGTQGKNSTYQNVFKMEMVYLAFPLALWLLAIIYKIVEKGRKSLKDRMFWILVAFLALALPMAAYHLQGQNMISVYKHMVYALLFLSPVAAWLMWSFMKRFNFGVLSQIVPALLVGGMLWLNYQQLGEMENGYPNVSPVLASLASKVDKNTTILSENPYLFRYAEYGKVPQSHIKELSWMDNNLDGKFEDKDVMDALWDAKFTYVYLDDLIRPDLNEKIRGFLLDRAYDKVLEIPYNTSHVMNWKTKGNMELYKRKIEPRISLKDDMMFK